ncbi:hypothetical protein [Janthinobacterium sp. PC23-8]|uniref:hypothetical protein n=1 Tax=Janthinobacterium sp. PC23-8 TaxID=2012679 RepID=UPI000B9664B5|nr:hypothetical protein [Janthinobacterium sp. PC23-8]OYO25807.1 hypothetical protein CD932_27345 [Janthinobacterium sp. PC23-8]
MNNKNIRKTFAAVIVGIACAAWGNAALAATPEAKAAYKSANEQAGVNYKAAHAECEKISGNPKEVCIAEAKAVRAYDEAVAQAQYTNTLRAYTKARVKIADANYDVDHKRCDALTGNDKDVCIKLAKSTKVAALADAKADKKVIEARSDARDEKRKAEYKVAAEKCDALAGAAKDDCVKAAKLQFGY